MQVPCGKCIGCRLDRSREWALRAIHELRYHQASSFVTLTYADKFMPQGRTLVKDDLQRFFKRLRKRLPHKKLQYIAAGEYGEQQDPNDPDHLGRPHYHIILYGFDFPDKEPFRVVGENQLYISEFLQELWPYGIHSIGQVTFESAAYVGRYCVKKIGGEAAIDHYTYTDPETGEFFTREPEYLTASKRPAIGKRWFEDFYKDCRKGYVTHDGVRYPVPKYYLKLLEDISQVDFEKIKEDRRAHTDVSDFELTPNRLRTRESVKLHKAKSLKRNLPHET